MKYLVKLEGSAVEVHRFVAEVEVEATDPFTARRTAAEWSKAGLVNWEDDPEEDVDVDTEMPVTIVSSTAEVAG